MTEKAQIFDLITTDEFALENSVADSIYTVFVNLGNRVIT